MSTCLSTIKSSNSTDDITGSNACNAEFKKFAAPWVIGYVLAAILSIYFAFVINRYAKHCKSNEKISP
ncbi:5124_t:CDS:2, partial [Gigaspora margarita]